MSISKQYKVLISETAIKQLNKLETKDNDRIKQALLVLKEEPYRARPKADIKKLKGFTNPSLCRLRIGDFRVIYVIAEDAVKVTEVFHRGKGYSWLE